MKILVATALTQGDRRNDYNYCVPGEPVWVQDPCDRDRRNPDGGCGTDAAPYFRIFNPVTQGRRFDPDGDYIRRYVPELADVADPHEPGVLAPDYPGPIVDHRVERDVALARFQALGSRASS